MILIDVIPGNLIQEIAELEGRIHPRYRRLRVPSAEHVEALSIAEVWGVTKVFSFTEQFMQDLPYHP